MKSPYLGWVTTSSASRCRSRFLQLVPLLRMSLWRRLARLVAISTIAIMSVGVEDATAFPSQWSVTSSPNHEGGVNQLNGVSCPTKKVCIAVGAWFSAGAGLPQTLIRVLERNQMVCHVQSRPEQRKLLECSLMHEFK